MVDLRLSINDYVNGSYTQTTSTVAAEPTLVINTPAGDYITVRNLETLEFDDATKSLEEVLEPFSQNHTSDRLDYSYSISK